jgi:hypothetical protein
MTTRNDVHIAVIGLSGEDKSEFIRLCIGEETGVASKIRGWITQSSCMLVLAVSGDRSDGDARRCKADSSFAIHTSRTKNPSY